MIIHQNDYLEIFFDKPNNLFIQNWRKSPESTDTFKREMLFFVEKHKEFNPSKSLWLHKNFTFIMDDETNDWAEEYVVKPCRESGNEKFAFVVSKDVMSHLSVMDSFEGLNIPNMPKHFISEDEALKWLLDDVQELKENKKTSIYFEGTDPDGNMVLKIDNVLNAENILNLFKNLRDENTFYSNNAHKYGKLTNREKEILFNYLEGKSIKQISEVFNISILTVRTHWRNIKKKLEIESFVDLVQYKTFY